MPRYVIRVYLVDTEKGEPDKVKSFDLFESDAYEAVKWIYDNVTESDRLWDEFGCREGFDEETERILEKEARGE